MCVAKRQNVWNGEVQVSRHLVGAAEGVAKEHDGSTYGGFQKEGVTPM